MNIDEIVNRLTKPNREFYLDYLRALNPTLINFFNYFTQNPSQSQEWFIELSENFFNKIRGRDNSPKQCKQLVLKGAINLILRKEQGGLLTRCKELIYEDVLIQPLPKRILSNDYIPNAEDLERFRTQQLSTPMCLILDLIFQEKLQTQETAKILRLSENVFEPFLFTVVHQLIGETIIENTDQESELELFTRTLHSSGNLKSENQFIQQVSNLKNFLSLDIRDRLDQAILLSFCNKHFPTTMNGEEFETTVLDSKSSSLIEQIKQRNQDMKLDDAARQFSKQELTTTHEVEIHNPPRAINEKVLHYAKYAFGILAIFTTMALYQTIYDQKKIPSLIANDTMQSTSISDFQAKLLKPIGNLSTLENEIMVSEMQWIKQANDEAVLTLEPDVEIQVSENTKLQVRSSKDLFLKFGSIRINTKNSQLKIYSNDGIVIIGSNENINSSAHVAKPHRNYSVAGNIDGNVIVQTYFDEQVIELNVGQQIIFGDTKANKIFPYNSVFYEPTPGSPQLNSKLKGFSTQILSNSLSEDELKDILLTVEKVIKKPTVQQKDFSQKL